MAKVRLGFIGVGNRGTQLLHGFMKNDGCEIVALCDVYKPYTTRDPEQLAPEYRQLGKSPKMGEGLGDVGRYEDFRELLARDDVDAVVIATPDHWHAVQTIAAFRAGKDVFVEKPLTITIREGRRMVEVQQETGRVAGVCLNRRGSSVYQKLVQDVRSGKVGPVKAAYASHNSVMAPSGIGQQQPAEPPADLNWDLWLGPRPERPYQYNLAPYFFRWWSDYSSQMGNWGVHYMDVIRWMTGETAPVAVSAVGTKSAVPDDRTIPDTLAVLFEMPSGLIIHFDVNEASGALRVPKGEVMLCGTKGTLCADQNRFHITPTKPGQFQDWKPALEEESFEVGGEGAYGDLAIKEDSTQNLIDNFVECVRTRQQPYCSLEDAHRSTTFAHLANISLAVRQRIEWDAEAERITNLPEANDLLHYEYRAPWSLE
ncbi:MAG: Gfo/Idh/MocA family protein [Planctomycetota bacterium]